MEFFKQTNIDFMGLRKFCGVLSVIIFILSLVSLVHYGLNLGLDFTGGTQIQVSFTTATDLPQIRSALQEKGFPEAQVVSYGSSSRDKTQVLIKVGVHHVMTQEQLQEEINQILPSANIESIEYIGPEVGKELAMNGIFALLVVLFFTTVYIAVRFETRLGISSAIALIHDPILILGIFSFWQVDFDITALVAVLTVIGYSLNDTIVVFDRIRENFRKLRKASPAEIVNDSVNQTLSRTIMTSALTLVAVLSLFIYGGPKVHSFSLAMLIGIVIGTYSSVYVAGSLAVALGLDRKDFLPPERSPIDDLP